MFSEGFIGIYDNAYIKQLLNGYACDLPYLTHNYILNYSDDELFIAVTEEGNYLDYLHTTNYYPKTIAGFIEALNEVRNYAKDS